MTLHLYSLPVRMSAIAQAAGERGWTRRRGGDFDAGRALHHLLSESFGKGAIQPFRLMVPRGRDLGRIYGYGTAPAGALRQMAATIAPPEIAGAINAQALQSKPMPAFQAGQRLGIDVMARPVRRLRHPLGQFGAGAELDVWLINQLRGETQTREGAYLGWLAERMVGAELDPAASRVAGMLRRQVLRGQSATEGPEVTFHGTITVSDPDGFAGLLARGLGRHCAYGYGMVLLRAPNAPVPKG